jgi:3-isopropylmalate/(R)-2-methylmalate dehydratase large subunit
MMGMTMTEKILAKHAGVKSVRQGDTVTCKIDWAAAHDMFFTVGGQINYEKIQNIADPSKCIVLIDHAVPAPTAKDAEGAVKARAFVKKHNIKNFIDVGNHGVIHQLLVERGYAQPGRLIACADSHTCAAGAMNCAARGFGPADMVYTWCKGENWYKISPTILYNLSGSFPDMVMGKDLFLFIAGKYGDAINKNIEFGGPGLANMEIPDRQSVATMCAEINAEFVVFPCDQKLRDFLNSKGIEKIDSIEPDKDAKYVDIRNIDLTTLAPYVAMPHFIPNNCKPVAEVEGLKLNQVIIGSCSNGRIEDLALAARILKGRHIARGVRLIVTPVTQKVYLEALKAGYLETLVEAGAVVTNATCGACYGGHMGLIGPNERCLSTTTRNFKGRMGSADSEIILSSPATAAASAISGYIIDPRKILEG